MLPVINLSRAQPVARNLLLITKRYQQSSTPLGSSGTSSSKSAIGSITSQSTTKNPSSTSSTTQTPSSTVSSTHPPRVTSTAPPNPSSPSPRAGPSTTSSYPSAASPGGSKETVKAIVYGVALGLGFTLLYAEYDNGTFRRKVERNLPLSSTILSGLDKIIDPLFGRQKKLTTIVSEKLPDGSTVTDKLPDKNQIKKVGDQVKDAATTVYNKLPSQKQIEKAGEQAKDAINDAYDKLPEYKKVKGAINDATDQVKGAVKSVGKTLSNAKDQVEETAKSVRDTVKDSLPSTKGVSGEPTRRGNDPVFLEEPGAIEPPPPIKRK